MLMLMLKSGWAQVSNWAVDRALGSLVRVAALSHDDDMCLLLRVEVPRSCYRTAS
jgi:hypothetical protein